ncbi:hypothetical protein [Pseudomonas shirazensis]
MKVLIMFSLAFLFFSCKNESSHLNNSIENIEASPTRLNQDEIEYMQTFFKIKERYWLGSFSIIEFKKENNHIVKYEYLQNLKVDKRKMDLKIVNGDTIFSIPKKEESYKIRKNGDLEVYENRKLIHLFKMP